MKSKSAKSPVRYAVVGLGHFAQTAVLPAFAKLKNAKLTAIVSGDSRKLESLGAKYHVEQRLPYEALDALFASGKVDAVYIVLPNSMHADVTVRAARAGVHVLCEKPMATNEADCKRMVDAARAARVKLMIAYRLHFEAANLAAIEAVRQGKVGEPRFISSTFSMQVKPGNSRLRADLGGGPLNDIGIYCINAARYLFGDEPTAVQAFSARTRGDERFDQVPEQVAVILRFPRARLASFIASFGAADSARCELVGTTGSLRLEPAFHHASELVLELQTGKRTRRRTFKKRDQVAAEIEYFSECVQNGREPEPSGMEGLADVRIIHAIEAAISRGGVVEIEPVKAEPRPSMRQERRIAPHPKPKTVHVEAPSAK